MKRIIFLTLLIFTFSVFSFGQSQPDYSGVWTLNLRKSKVFQGMLFPAITKLVTQSEKQIENLDDLRIPVVESENKTKSVIYKFDWGENTNDIVNANVKTTIITKSGFNKENNFEIVQKQIEKVKSKEIETSTIETWRLENLGKTLIVKTISKNANGEQFSEIFYEKDDSADILNPVLQLNKIGVANGTPSLRIQPTYPIEAKKAKADGSVCVLVLFNEEGTVLLAKAISGHPALLMSSESAARLSRFSPTKKLEGKFIETGLVVYNFVKN